LKQVASAGDDRSGVLLLKHVNDLVVLFVWTDPKPNNLVTARKNANCAIVPTDTCRDKVWLVVDSLKIQTGMARIFAKEFVGGSCLLAHVIWK
jgi:hypothetical protein